MILNRGSNFNITFENLCRNDSSKYVNKYFGNPRTVVAFMYINKYRCPSRPLIYRIIERARIDWTGIPGTLHENVDDFTHWRT